MTEPVNNQTIPEKVSKIKKHSQFLNLGMTLGVALISALGATQISSLNIDFNPLTPFLGDLINFAKNALAGATIFSL